MCMHTHALSTNQRIKVSINFHHYSTNTFTRSFKTQNWMNEWMNSKEKQRKANYDVCMCVGAYRNIWHFYYKLSLSPCALSLISASLSNPLKCTTRQRWANTHTHAQWNGTNINYDGRKGCSLTGLFAWTNKIWDNSRNLTNLNCFWKKRPGRATQKKAIKNPIIKSRLKSTTVREYDLYDVRRRTAVLWYFCHIHIRVEERNICNSHILNIIILLSGPKWTHHTLNNNVDVCFFCLSFLFCFVFIVNEHNSTWMWVPFHGHVPCAWTNTAFSHCIRCIQLTSIISFFFSPLRRMSAAFQLSPVCRYTFAQRNHLYSRCVLFHPFFITFFLSLFLSLHSVILSLLLRCARAIQKDDAPFCNYLSCCAKYFLLGPMYTPLKRRT